MTGPLASLTDSTPKLSVLQFPSDLGSRTRAHYVQFSILEVISGGYKFATGGTTTNIFSTTGQIGTTGGAPGLVTTDAGSTVAIQISPPTQNPVAYISLYMPETVVAQYEHGYQEDNLTDYALAYFGKAVSTLFDAKNKLVDDVTGGNVLNSISSNPSVLALLKKTSLAELIPVDQLLKGQGLAINPQVQLLFKATALRQFQFNFLFTPSSREEAEEVKKIIKAFKYHAAPEIGGGAINNDLFFKMPDIFEIKFFYENGKENDKIHKIDKCVLKTIDLDYAASGGGWTAYEEGYPVQTRMTLTFEELSIQDKKQINLGY